jgi:hypothetical protein
MKKAYAIGLIVVLSLLLLLGAFLIINGVQRDQAYKTVRTFTFEDERAKLLVNKANVRKTVDCSPEASISGKCEAVEYTVTAAECVNILQAFDTSEIACNKEVSLTYRDQHIKIIAGALYDGPNRQIRILLDEPHLLSMWK